MSRTRTAVVALIAACMSFLLAAVPAFADPQDDQARVEREIARTRAALEVASERVASAAEAYEKANQLLPGVQRRLANARGVLAEAQARATSAARAARGAAAELAAADKALTNAVLRVDQTRDDIGRHAASAYMGRDLAGIDALMSVESPADFVTGLTYMEHIAQEQQRALDANTQARAYAADQQDVQVARKAAADKAHREAKEALREAAEAEEEAERAEQEVAALVAQRERALEVAKEERAATQARYKELLAESERIAAEIRALARNGGTVLQSARLPMPVDGWKSSDFGMRYDPFYQVWQLHAGVDFAAAGGSPIWAVQSGKVFRAGWNGGYGNYTCIYHGIYNGKGFASCYAHQSAILVSVGQQVRQGQVIGRVGTTGASTGNHLHFEIRLDGDPVDPLPYLPACLC